MSRFSSILSSFAFDPQAYADSISKGLDGSQVKKNISRLNAVTKALEQYDDDAVSDLDIKEIYEYIRVCFLSGIDPQDVALNKKQLRALSYAMKADDEYNFVKFVIAVMELNWSSAYFKGMLHSMLFNWLDLNVDTRVAICSFIYNKIMSGSSATARRISDIAAYMNESGPEKLGIHLRDNGLKLEEALHIFNFTNSKITYSFYSDVIVEYYRGQNSTRFADIRKTLSEHNNIRTTKTLLPLIVLDAAKRKKLDRKIIDFAIMMIGDPTILSKWAPFDGATQAQADNLKKAREAIMAALSAEVINIFFEQLCDDEKRKDFWLQHTDSILNFTVYGPDYAHSVMENHVSKPVLKRHFQTVTSKYSTCALVMYMGDYAIIEFTDVGALYAYKLNGANYKATIGKSHIDAMDDLKIPTLLSLVSEEGYRTTYEDEGRLVHIGHWQRRMDKWLKAHIND